MTAKKRQTLPPKHTLVARLLLLQEAVLLSPLARLSPSKPCKKKLCLGSRRNAGMRPEIAWRQLFGFCVPIVESFQGSLVVVVIAVLCQLTQSRALKLSSQIDAA